MDANMLYPECDGCVYWSYLYGTCDYEDLCPHHPEDERIEEDDDYDERDDEKE